MNSFSFLQTSITYLPAIAALCCVAMVLLLLAPLRAQARRSREQALAIASLHEQIGQGAQARLELYDLIDALCEQCARLQTQPGREPSRPVPTAADKPTPYPVREQARPDTRRFGKAVSMIRRGVGDVQALHDLGLSSGEAELLMRLNPAPAAVDADARTPTRAGQASGLVQMLEA